MDDDSNKTPCKYGAECFRKNKEHREKFGHPAKNKRKSEEVSLHRTGLFISCWPM